MLWQSVMTHDGRVQEGLQECLGCVCMGTQCMYILFTFMRTGLSGCGVRQLADLGGLPHVPCVAQPGDHPRY